MRQHFTEFGSRVFTFCVFLTSLSIQADTITLKNGTVLEGEIVSQSQQQIQLRAEQGIIKIQRANVRRIVFSATKPEAKPGAEKKKAEKVQPLKKSEQLELEKKEAEEAARIKREKEEAEQARAKELALKEEERKRGLWRRAAIPGWSQHHAGQSTRGGLFFAGAATSLFLYTDGRNRFLAAQGDFLSAADSARMGILFPGNALTLNALARLRAAQAAKTMQSSGTQATLGLGLLLGVYGFHLADVSRLANAGSKVSAAGQWSLDLAADCEAQRWNQVLQVSYHYNLEF